MKLAGYELVKQIGAGRDGISYQARDVQSDALVELRDVTRASQNTRRWHRLSQRLKLAALVSSPAAVKLVELRLSEPPALVVSQWADQRLIDNVGNVVSVVSPTSIVGSLAQALATAHAIGLAHGNICLSGVRLQSTQPKIDFSHLLATRTPLPRRATRLDGICRPPPTEYGTEATADDVFSLGALFIVLLASASGVKEVDSLESLNVGRYLSPELKPLVQSMLAEDPLDRPSASEVASHLGNPLPEIDPGAARAMPTEETAEFGRDSHFHVAATTRLGRFQLLDRLGTGGMGAVYRARDTADGSIVAVKVLKAELTQDPDAVRRFRKEAQLLAEIDNPHVAKLLAANQDNGTYYIAMELVEGRSLAAILAESGALPERTAAAILADVARALVEPHQRGIVHRDVKPENILVDWPKSEGGTVSLDADSADATDHVKSGSEVGLTRGRTKLVDFGLGRHFLETESLGVTQPGTILGTPLYMAPEQCLDRGPLGPHTDVYGMGATLFHALAGRPPFVGADKWDLITQHCDATPPRVADLCDELSENIDRVVDKTLAKSPDARYRDAAELLADLQRLLHGESLAFEMHPLTLGSDERVLSYEFGWELHAPPNAIWPHVSNTDRLNEAIGLAAVDFSTRVGSDGTVDQFGSLRLHGRKLAWQEHPFEWVEGRRLSVLREFSEGPFIWFASIVELEPSPNNGTRLSHCVRILPRSLLGRVAAAFEIGIKARRNLERVYLRVDQVAMSSQPTCSDPFRTPHTLRAARRRRLDDSCQRLAEGGVDANVLAHLRTFLAQAAAQDLARIRPLAFADRFELDADAVVAVFLEAAREGLLILLWDILCPLCRIPADIKDTLRALESHGYCPACNLDFELDFANSVEMIFRASPRVRDSDAKTYCVGGPAHSPHVVAQIRLASQESVRLEMELADGSYCLRVSPSGLSVDFEVGIPGETLQWELAVDKETPPSWVPELMAHRQLLLLSNSGAREQLVRIERMVPRAHVLTAAHASSLAAFRRLFPEEILSPGQMISVAGVSLLIAAVANDEPEESDIATANRIRQFVESVTRSVERFSGAVVKTVGANVYAAFHDPGDAVRAAFAIPGELTWNDSLLSSNVRMAVDHGSATIATLGGQLDYLGRAATTVSDLIAQTAVSELSVTQAVAGDPMVASFFSRNELSGTISLLTSSGQTVAVHRFCLDHAPANVADFADDSSATSTD